MKIYYLTQRPPMPGAFPGRPIEINYYDGRKYVPEIGRQAWGWVGYDKPLTDKQAKDYELTEAKGEAK